MVTAGSASAHRRVAQPFAPNYLLSHSACLLAIAVGILVLVWPSISALALLYVIGADAVVLGLVSILFGIVIFARPGDGALVTLALTAAFALVTSITEVVAAIGGKRRRRKVASAAAIASTYAVAPLAGAAKSLPSGSKEARWSAVGAAPFDAISIW
jgi:uncharacterized membrane protein HdeD (DUF308 family)